ncbi:MAG: hypothetical protein ACJ0G1_08385 [Gammaproteobacteria bacterium]
MNLQELFDNIAESLDLESGSISIESSSENIDSWDSLGHITILGMLDDATNGTSADIVDLTQATSVAEIVQILSDNGMLDD